MLLLHPFLYVSPWCSDLHLARLCTFATFPVLRVATAALFFRPLLFCGFQASLILGFGEGVSARKTCHIFWCTVRYSSDMSGTVKRTVHYSTDVSRTVRHTVRYSNDVNKR